MKQVTLDISDGMLLTLSKTYVENFGTEVVRILDESLPKGLCVRWDEREIQFISREGGVAFKRAAIEGYFTGYFRHGPVRWPAFYVQTADCGHMVLYCTDLLLRPKLIACIDAIIAAGAPIHDVQEYIPRKYGQPNTEQI